LKVSLPGNLVGTVPITNISSAYTSMLRNAADSTVDETCELPPLSSLYSEGDVVATAVVSVDTEEGSKNKIKHNLILSLSPSRVMDGRLPVVGELCTAAIESKEDHGYILDIGSTTVRGFVPNKSMSKIGEVDVGKVLWCVVNKVEPGVRTLTPLPGKIWAQELTNPTMHNLFPGSKVKGKVEGILENGLKVKFGDGLLGYVHSDHLKDPADFVEAYDEGSEIEARLLYITPTVNTVMLTLREINNKEQFIGIKSGQLLEGATIEKVRNNRLTLNLGNGNFGFVSVRHMKEGKEVVKNVNKKFKVGEKLNTRILALDFCVGMAVCSIQASLLSGIQRIDQLEIGQLVTVTVKNWVKDGLLVTLGQNLTGMVPRLFLSDVQLSKPELKYHPGEKYPAKVLKMDPANNKLHLTTKPILVKEQFDIVKDFETAVPGTITEGVVVKISQHGLLVQLWGNVKGWVPKSQLSLEQIDYPEKLFWLGQAVKCRVLDADEKMERISLSLILDSMNPLGKKERRKQILKLGVMYTSTVQKLSDEGVEVLIDHEGHKVTASIPVYHLADDASLSRVILNNLSVGQKLDCMVCQKDVVTVLTLKQSLINNWSHCPQTFDEFEIGTVIPGVVALIKKFGVFLRVPYLEDLVLCPTRMFQDYFVEDPAEVIDIGQSLWVKVVEIDKEKQKIVVTCALEKVGWGQETMGGIVKEWLDTMNSVSGWSQTKVGDLISGIVTEVTDFGLLIDIDGTKGIVTNSNREKEFVEGDSISGVVIFVDSLAKVLEVSCQTSLINSVTTRKTNIPKTGSLLKGKIVTHKTEHSISVVSISNPLNFKGNIGFVGTRRHVNDLAGVDQGEEGKEVTLIVQSITERGELVLVLDRELRKSEKIKNKRTRSVSSSEDFDKSNKKKLRPSKISICEANDDSISADSIETETRSQNVPTSKSHEESHETSMEADDDDMRKPENKKEKRKAKGRKDSNPPSDHETLQLKGDSPKKSHEKTTMISDPGWDFNATSISSTAWQKASIWSDDELDDEEESDGKEKSHLSKSEAKKRKREEEQLAAAREQRILDGEVAHPTTVEEFERLVVASPDSSLVWVQYMALTMQGGDLEVARSIAKRALQRINFRLEEERLNIFLAWLNLENSFGSEEEMDKVLKEALQCCDQYKVYSQVAAIYQQSSKISEAEKIFKIMVRKFNKEKDVWVKYGIFYYKNNKLNDGRFVLQRSLQSLDKKDHLEMSSKFAQIEFRYGEPERGKTMFETILSNYPRRTDLWSVYADQLVKTGDIDAARALFKRMATLGLQAKKMKFLFKKWLDFETGHGTESGISEVRQAAQRYLEGKGGGESSADVVAA